MCEPDRENPVVPGGLWLFFPLTQHSAFGYVLGYDMPRLRRLIFDGRTPQPKLEGVLTQTLKPYPVTTHSP
jgi:hypothetical protein